MTPFELIDTIVLKEYQTDLSAFSAYMTNNYFSSSKDYLGFVELMNTTGASLLPPKMVYDFYYYAIPKRNKKLYLKYPKQMKTLEEIQEYQVEHKISTESAIENMKLKEFLKERMNEI